MLHHRERKPTRLHDFDYSMPGAYFLTAYTKNGEFLFQENEAQLAVESAWHSLQGIFANSELWEFGVMPNHVRCSLLYKKDRCVVIDFQNGDSATCSFTSYYNQQKIPHWHGAK